MSTSPHWWSVGSQRVPHQRRGGSDEPVMAGVVPSWTPGGAAAGERHPARTGRVRRPARPALLELVFDHIHSEWAMEIIRGVERVLAAEQAALVLSELDGDHKPRQDWFDDLLDRRPLGVIPVVVELDERQRRRLTAADIPFVFVDTAQELPPGVPAVGSANRSGGLSATRHLVELGHRRIAVISGPTRLPCSRARVEGFRSALAAAGLSAPPDHVRHGDFRAASGYRHGLELLDRPDRPTAIFAGSDYQALGVLRAAHELGLSVPRDLSVVGYDDLSIHEWSGPPLTTVRQPLRDMAAAAAEMVLAFARGRRPPHPRVELATELVVRQSTAPPRS
ncbi:substrate-binding domain-containing protein [Actinosynnema sp. NPDC059335]|uniref:substrate-binding domain-containing protein n=1 Tax=Actinosynnema sp. NPDC059335 TaxID=3346804 RepID=UPI00366D2096